MESVTYSDRWQELYELASAPSAAAGTGQERMSLASASAPGPGGDKLNHSGGPWTKASSTAGELRTNTETSRSSLGPGHEGIDAGTTGLTAVASLKAVLTSWEERLAGVRDECEYLTGALSKVAKEMGETDTAVESSFNAARKGGQDR
ncbi:hypothetical protein [Streptomyces sp. CB03238]|uniref:hypothetical protein n=1 Tax=Streptomyces sp. CB03238 TaxID=1907777 RepID=UPI00269E589F